MQLHLIVAGMHLSPEFGLTVQTIEEDGFEIGDRVEMLLSSDAPEAIAKSMGLGTIGFDAVKHLLLCRIEHRPPKLDLADYPYLPRARVEITPVSAYMSLLGAS